MFYNIIQKVFKFNTNRENLAQSREQKRTESNETLISIENNDSNEESVADERPLNCKEVKQSVETFEPKSQMSCNQMIDSKPKYECIECHKEFNRYFGYNCHLLKHKNQIQFKCEKCKQKFKRKSDLISHQKLHLDLKCKDCNKEFKTLLAFKTHVLYHSNERPFVCDWRQCGKRFKTIPNLNTHKRYVHLRERKFDCDYDNCDKSFFSKNELKIHKRIHTGEKPYVCDHKKCGKRFPYKSTLKTHLKVHFNTNSN